jgi:hypothetical protein
MTRKHWLLIALAVALGGFSLYLNKDWFAKDHIQITHRSRPARAGFFSRKHPAADSAVNPIVFGFNRKLKLKSIQVIPVSEIETNKYPHPIWHLISDSNSVPTKTFVYAQHISGMRPSVQGATADPLEPGTKYRLLVEANSFKSEYDFVPDPRTP